jgi:hypothetical protein
MATNASKYEKDIVRSKKKVSTKRDYQEFI